MFKKLLFFLFLLSFFSAKSQEKHTVQSAYQKGLQFLHKNRDSTYFYLNKTIFLAEKTDQIGYIMTGYSYLINANGLYFDLENFKMNLDKMESVLNCDPRFDSFAYKTYYKRRLLVIKGNYNYKLGNYEKSEEYFKRVLIKIQALSEKNPTRALLMKKKSSYNFLAAIYIKEGKYNQAKHYYNKSMDLLNTYQKKHGSSAAGKAYLNMSLAILYQKEKNYQKAGELLKKALSIYENLNKDTYTNSWANCCYLLANNYLYRNQSNRALGVLKNIKQKKLLDPDNLKFLKEHIHLKARAFSQQENFETALLLYQKALKTSQEYYQTKQHSDIAEIYSEMAQVFSKQQQFEKSFFHFQKALSALSENFESTGFADNPSPKKVLSKLKLIEILSEKQKSLATAYVYEKNLEYLKAANKTAKAIVKTLDALKPEFESKVDMQFLLEETYPAFYQMMETTFLLFEKTGKKQYLQDAFYFSEKSKAVLLLSAVQKTGATKFAGIPNDILTKEKQYRATINHLEKKHFKNPSDELLKNKLFDLKNEFYAFLNEIEEKYPKYHRLKYKTQMVRLQEIQDLLQPKEAMLDYYLADNYVYYFVIEKENIRLDRISFSKNFSERILQLQKHFSSPQVTKIKELKTLSNQVYQKLLPEIDPSISTLIIVRSGILNYIPFGALYDSEEKKYLIEDFVISYANSATLYQEYAQQNKINNQQLLAFAPSFEDASETHGETRIGLGPLLYNKKEVKLIGDYFEGDLLLNKEASLQAFENKAKEFGILHLATHAIINDKFPDYSYLAFSLTPQDSASNVLYIKDLYNYDLNASLVTLSACETGIGKLQKGAGMLSLARGFNYAGASSLVTTQWKINDKSASMLMKYFYKNLAKGKAKNTALRNAKLHYLKTNDDAMLRHPYYWAGFVLTGNTSAIVKKQHSDWSWWAVGGLICLVLILGFYYRKRLL